MPFQRPSLPDLIDRTSNEVSSRLGIGKLLARSVLWVLSRVFAGIAHMLHGHLDWLSKQLLPDTATGIWLERHASLHGISRKAAAAATGTVRFTGAGTATIPAGTVVQTADGKAKFSTDAEATLSSQQADVAVTATEAGLLGNTDPLVTLTLTSPVANINSEAVVQADSDGRGLTGGLDQEGDEPLRSRLLLKIRNPPQGGAVSDYINWALEVAGVTRVFVLPLQNGDGTVGVTFAVDDDPSGPLPAASKVTEVQDYIDDTTRRPATANVTVFQPTALPLNPDISLVPDTTELRAAVQKSLEDLVLREGGPGKVGGPTNDITVAQIREAISTTPGETGHTLNSPTSSVAAGDTQLHTMGSITWS